MENHKRQSKRIDGFTAVELRILAVLSDGMRHRKEELLPCLWADGGTAANLRIHITNIRKKLPQGQTIICENANRVNGYRHVRLLLSIDD